MSISTEKNLEKNTSKTSISNSGVALRPLVDIRDYQEHVVLQADIPGVSRENLSIEIDGKMLIIDGRISDSLVDKSQLTVVRMRADAYRRTFRLSTDIDVDNIGAELKDRLLTLTLPKRSEVLPKKIEVNAA